MTVIDRRLLLAMSLVALIPARALAETQYFMDGQPVTREVGEAVKILNDSVVLLQQNRNQEAVDALLQAEQMAPNVANIHSNLGLGLAKLGRNQEAIKELEIARSINPDNTSTLLTLGGIYQSQGQINQAIDTYNEFLKRAPQHKDAPKVASLVTGLKNELASGMISSAPPANGSADNYLGELGSRLNRWPASKMPIRVYIQPGDGVPNYTPTYMTILRAAFSAWQEASQGAVSFAFVPDAGQADLVCSFISEPSSLTNGAEAGETNLFVNKEGLVKGTIKLLTVPLVAELPLTDNRKRWLCLHEVGHALGFGGHTNNPQDIMFFSTLVSDNFPHLSARDASSLRGLYAGGDTQTARQANSGTPDVRP
ncbi:MAG: tetratricopeptide repeat protein [Cyanobacteria bacterium SZAS TMP-1]|nr:tetratricopeptide repeat protein [Cyanobacteria bacterium SZAS TMP-1]